MYVIIVGGGRSGETLAKTLVLENDDVVIVEHDEKRAKELADKIDALVIQGDAKDDDILKEAGMDKADALIVLTREDNINLLVCQIAKRANVPKIVARVSDPDNEGLFIQAGVNGVISTTHMVVTAVKNIIRKHGTNTLLTLAGGKLEFLEIYIAPTAAAVGKKVSKCGLPKNARIVSIERGDAVHLPNEDMELKENDLVGVMAKSGDAKKVLAALATK